MHTIRAYHRFDIPQYSEALLYSQDKKNCTNLAKALNKSHDCVYRNFEKSIEKQNEISEALINLAKRILIGDKKYLIFDDTILNKQYAHEIEGLDFGFDGSTKRPVMGLRMLTALLTDNIIKVPIDVMPYVSKQLAGTAYKSKSDIAIGITIHLISSYKIDMILADAHFATKNMISFLNKQQQSFLMKIPCNRIVTIGESRGQLKHILRLNKNTHVKHTKGVFNGIECYFYVVKIKDGSVVYFISSDQIDPHEVVNLYRIRWNIELFHRTAKQQLGLGHCQMRAIEKQRQHALYVMYAYAIADVMRSKMNFSCVEDAIRHLRISKSKSKSCAFVATGENLCLLA